MLAALVVCLLSQTDAGTPAAPAPSPTSAIAPAPAPEATAAAAVAPNDDGQTPKTRAPEVDEKLAQTIGQRLRCPVCQGMPISESPSEMAQAMMKRVRELLAEGKSRDEILAYFTQRYGEWVLLDPKKGGVNMLLWGLPPVALLLGLLVLRRYARRTSTVTQVSATATPTDDPYLAAVRNEVER